MRPRKILFCTDFSENSELARELALDYAKAFGAELMIIHVIDTTAFPDYADWVGDDINKILNQAERLASTRLDSMAAECRQVLKDVKTWCKRGSAANVIVSLAEQESVDLIVMGTHGRTGVTYLVMGSIARSVLRMAHRPVLIVEGPPGKGESSRGPHLDPVK